MYRVSHNTVSTFVFWTSRLPRGLEIPYLTFFKSPFCVDFRNIHFLFIWWFMCSHVHSCALKSTYEYSAMVPWAPMSADECSRLMTALELSWVLIPNCVWVFMAAPECSLAIKNNHGFCWLLISAHECSRLLMSTTHEKPWPLLSLAQ